MKVYDFNVKERSGKEINLGAYEGKVLLIVNSATQCGFTPQYGDLQKLYNKYSDKGFVILDFPCNQFKNQAPGTADEIQQFCESNYGVTYPIHDKIEVNGENAHPLYKFLKSERGFKGLDNEHPLASKIDEIISKDDKNYKESSDIKWNFTKFLVDRKGNVIERFEPTKDLSHVEARIMELL
ncbi:MAG: glutathione peroxidase [Clostridiales bacterium]|jgi:glutathione peroxidase|nr:glutathione peroxidase [Clostridiales bacterium]